MRNWIELYHVGSGYGSQRAHMKREKQKKLVSIIHSTPWRNQNNEISRTRTNIKGRVLTASREGRFWQNDSKKVGERIWQDKSDPHHCICVYAELLPHVLLCIPSSYNLKPVKDQTKAWIFLCQDDHFPNFKECQSHTTTKRAWPISKRPDFWKRNRFKIQPTYMNMKKKLVCKEGSSYKWGANLDPKMAET